jgi:CRP-like cAMP-binding protein
MREGDIGDEMFIITEGSVRIERKGEQLASTFDSDESSVQNLGKLQELDFFGELAVLTQREDGTPHPRTRSAVCASNSCVVQSLNYASLQDARVRSPTIDAAVRQAVSQIYMRRPSLSRREQTSTQQRFEKLEELNAQVLGLQKEIAEQMMDLKHSIAMAS